MQGTQWQYAQLAKDLCNLHASEVLTALLRKRLEEPSKLSAPEGVQEPTLQSLQDECIACFAAGLETTACNKHVSAHEWVHVIASPQSAGHGATDSEQTKAFCAKASQLSDT